MTNEEFLEDVYAALFSFCGEQSWKGTFQGNVLERLAEKLEKPSPYIEE